MRLSSSFQQCLTFFLIVVLGSAVLASAFYITLPSEAGFVSSGSKRPAESSGSRPSLLLSSPHHPQNSESETIHHDLSWTILELPIWRMTHFFASMVSPTDHRFYSHCYPMCHSTSSGNNNPFDRQHNPIRELASAWDASTVLLFWEHQHVPTYTTWRDVLQTAIRCTLEYYSNKLDPYEAGGLVVSEEILDETSNIAHSAFLVLAALNARELGLESDAASLNYVDGLLDGILSQQATNGAFRIPFLTHCASTNSDPTRTTTTNPESADFYQGIEFYPGEAMVALMEAYKHEESKTPVAITPRARSILDSMEQAFDFYSSYFYDRRDALDANYSIWQVQAFARYFKVLLGQECGKDNISLAQAVAKYVVDLCDVIVDSRSWKELARGKSFYPNLQTVEIACGLDALAQGIHVVQAVRDLDRSNLYWRHARNAVDFLRDVQNQVQLPDQVGFGGLGSGGLQVLEERLDVTGHAMSGFIKVHCEGLSRSARNKLL